MVLQRDRQVEQPLAGTEPHVPATAERLQAARCSRVGRTSVFVPSRHTREAAGAVRCIDGKMESHFLISVRRVTAVCVFF